MSSWFVILDRATITGTASKLGLNVLRAVFMSLDSCKVGVRAVPGRYYGSTNIAWQMILVANKVKTYRPACHCYASPFTEPPMV